MMPRPAETGRGVVLVIAPVGRDASACATLVAQVGLEPRICAGVDEAITQLQAGVDVVLLTEEALYGKPLALLADWVASQPPWSDQPFIVLTNHNAGPRFTDFRRDLVGKLRNIAFLERPLQAISLQAAVLTAQRGRARQYQARAYLEAQRGAADELERLVALRTAALEEANERLREESERRERAQAALMQAQKIETMGQLVGGVAHDFNNLLMAVIGNLDLLTRYVVNDPRQERLLKGALEGARRGATLTQRLLAFARKQELQTRPVDVGALVEGMHGLIERSVGPMIDLKVRVGASLSPALADANQVEMALLNLTINARDAMPAGGSLVISIDECAAGPDQPRLSPGRYVRLSVRDTGEGMDAATLEKAVEPFFSTKGVGKGTGLGLSMVHGLAEQSGGLFTLSSEPGRGATATLWLPAAVGAVAEAPPAADPKQAVRPATILLVDDDPLIAASTTDLLEDLGHRVVEVHSGPEALGALDSGLRPDLVITDHAMPGMTGAELAARIRRRSPAVPILLATGYAELQGAQGIDLPRLAKPYTQAQLSAEISRLLPGRGP
jgi:signal transduction histidine kinase